MTKDFEELHFILFILNKPFNTNNTLIELTQKRRTSRTGILKMIIVEQIRLSK